MGPALACGVSLLGGLVMTVAAHAADLGTIRIGVLQFGTVNWELDVIEHHGLDAKEGFDARDDRLCEQRCGRRGADGRGGRRHRRGLAVGLAPARRRRAAHLHPLFEQRRRPDGAGRRRHRQPGRPRGQAPGHRRRPARQELAPDPGARQGAGRRPRRGHRAGLRRAAAACRKIQVRRAGCGDQLLALRRPPRGRGPQAPDRCHAGPGGPGRAGRHAAARLRVPRGMGRRARRPGSGVRPRVTRRQGDHGPRATRSGSACGR